VTYSIVAHDPQTGEMGVGAQSHWFSVGSIVSWARAGVGAVATQSVAQPAYGPRGLELMAAGAPAPEALRSLRDADELARVRQVAFVDARGRVAVHTGDDCIACAGHVLGDGFSCQANMMERDTVPGAMAQAFEAHTGTLTDRIVAAMEAAEGEGGDVRGRQSASLRVVPKEGEPWDAEIDLRVEDHPDPIAELKRLVRLQRAYALADEADQQLGAGRPEEAGPLYRQAAEIAPESDELLFWAGRAIAQTGDLEGGADAVRRAAEANPNWIVLLERLSPEFAPAGAAVLRQLRQ
jgi:uncharacterized Ntn-hydrolase superfamily protein